MFSLYFKGEKFIMNTLSLQQPCGFGVSICVYGLVLKDKFNNRVIFSIFFFFNSPPAYAVSY